MRVLVTGATGYLGGAIARRLLEDGHEVAGTARSRESAAALAENGIEAVEADLTDPVALGRAASGFDAVVHAAAINGPERAAADRAAVEALLRNRGEEDGALIYTSGTWVLGDTGDSVATESWPLKPLAVNAWQVEVEEAVLGARSAGVRTAVVRPATVHGAGGGALAAFTSRARERGAARVVGTGRQLWSTVHLDDVADLYARVLRASDAGGVFHAASGCAYPVRDLALAASLAAGVSGAVESWALDDARERMGPIAESLALTQRVEAPRARSVLGWVPRGPTALEDLLSAYRTG